MSKELLKAMIEFQAALDKYNKTVLEVLKEKGKMEREYINAIY